MNTIIKFLGILSIVVWMNACEENTATDTLLIKIRNDSQYEFQNVVVNTGGGERTYGKVKANRESEYQPFEYAYAYAFVKVTIGGEEYRIQPIDYVGEKMLSEGRYAYVISVSEVGNEYTRLSLKLRYD